MAADPIVFVVDDDDAVRDSLLLLLRAAGRTARGFPSADAFLADFDPDTPGCLIADIRMPGIDGLELQERLHRAGDPLPIIILTGHGDVPAAVSAMKRGALDFLEKPYEPGALLELVDRAIESDAQRRDELARASEINDRVSRLTPREQEVIELVARGHANKVIGIELGISERTVELHRARGLKKLGVRTVADLVGLIGIDDEGDSAS